MKLKFKIYTRLLFLLVLSLSVSNTIFASNDTKNKIEFSEKEIEEEVENHNSELFSVNVDVKLACDGNGGEHLLYIHSISTSDYSKFIYERITIQNIVHSSTPIYFTPAKYILFASLLVYS